MLPGYVKEEIREIFDQNLTGGVKLAFFTRRRLPVYLPGREECQSCEAAQELLTDLASISPKLHLTVHDFDEETALVQKERVQRPSATVCRGVLNRPVTYYGLPGGEQFGVLVGLCVGASRGATIADSATKRRLKRIRRDLPVELYVKPDDSVGAEVARSAVLLALESSRLRLSISDIADTPALAESAPELPLLVIDSDTRHSGPIALEALLAMLIARAEQPPPTSQPAPAWRPPPVTATTPLAPGEELRPSGLVVPRH